MSARTAYTKLPNPANASPESKSVFAGPLRSELANRSDGRGYVDASEIDKLFPPATALAGIIYVAMVALVYLYTPAEYVEELSLEEKMATFVSAVVMFVTILAMVAPFVIRRSRPSGVVVSGASICFIAMTTNLLMCIFPTAVMVDPVTRARVFLLRWCEWMPLGGLMTFLSEAVYMSQDVGGLEGALFSGAMQSMSIVCGILLPLCPNPPVWWAVFIFSFLPYFYIFPRVMLKRRSYLHGILTGEGWQRDERKEQLKFAYYLILACSIVWTVLVVLYCVNMYIHMGPPGNRWYHHKSLAMIVDTFFDVLAKAIYMKLITDVHHSAFDIERRTHRQLLELRKLMRVMWGSSSDNIIISVRSGSSIFAMFSPSFASLVAAKTVPQTWLENPNAAIMLSTENGEMLCQFVVFDEIRFGERDVHSVVETIKDDSPVAREAKRLLEVIWRQDLKNENMNSPLLEHPVGGFDGEIRQCEVIVSFHSANARVGVVRDISERFKRMLAERKVHQEMIARQKDAQAVNRFTKHEVKNGLLEGIELCGSLRASIEDLLLEISKSSQSGSAGESLDPDQKAETLRVALRDKVEGNELEILTRRCVEDLDRNLHDILDTILTEAMARDVIHGDYMLRRQDVDIRALLATGGLGIGISDRFPISFPKGPVPTLSLDSQLIRLIHRNAISNACKYGKQRGIVVTTASFDRQAEKLELQVINEPGPNHAELVLLGASAEEVVFTQGASLHSEHSSRQLSAGDGAWIMKKCAMTLGGECAIEFQKNRTVFRLVCPAKAASPKAEEDFANFCVPDGTWGVAIDDSRVQRRLLLRILGFAGVEESRRSVLGSISSDVSAFENSIANIVHSDSKAKVLVIVDENLDFGKTESFQGMVSGSILAEKILASLKEGDRKRVLCLVRSANDSADDIAMYTSRTHGFFPKGPMEAHDVRQIIGRVWRERFPTDGVPADDDESMTPGSTTILAASDKQDIRESIFEIDVLLEEGMGCQRVWGALHALKGDIMVLESSDAVNNIAQAISSLRGCTSIDVYTKKWAEIRKMILSFLA